MLKRISSLLVTGAFAVVLLAQPLMGAMKPTSTQADEFEKFNNLIQQGQLQRAVKVVDESTLGSDATRHFVRSNIGRTWSPTGAAAPGAAIFPTNEDWAYSQKDRQVDWSVGTDGVVRVHFVGNNKTTTTQSTDGSGYWYNYYDATNGTWPNGVGAGAGSVVQATDGTETGLWPNSAINPNNGQIVLYGSDDLPPFGAGVGPSNFEAKMYFQTSDGGTFWGFGQSIPPSQRFLGDTDSLSVLYQHPQIDINVVGADTVMHVLAHTNFLDVFPALTGADGPILHYYRRVLTPGVVGPAACSDWGDALGDTTCWSGPTVIDTAGYRGTLAASPFSSKVGIAWLKYTATAFANDQASDQDVFFIESADGGVTFGAPQNVTNYDRVNGSGLTNAGPFIETHSIYSSDDEFHVLWNANPWPAGVYDSASFFFGDFSSSIYHWGTAQGVVSRVKNADWGLQFNIPICGFGGTNSLYVSFFSISECDGNLYTIWSQVQDVVNTADVNDPANIIDDCASGLPPGSNTSGVNDAVFLANEELWISVSSTLDGVLWDPARNISNTYTPACDSAGFGGVCMAETKATMARYGQDITGLDFTQTEAAAAEFDPTGSYAGSNYLHVLYVDDRYPGEGVFARGPISENALTWVRLACIDPVVASIISASPTSLAFPNYATHGVQLNFPVTITNDGNDVLNITSQTITLLGSTPGGAIATSPAGAFSVPAGVGNVATLTVQLNPGGAINSPGTVVELAGSIDLANNSSNNPNVTISINTVVADTVIEVEFDTIATPSTALAVSSIGGHGVGTVVAGGVNLDYTATGGDCDANASTYVFDGGPFVITGVGGTPLYTTGLFNQSIADTTAFKRIAGTSPASVAGPNYDGYVTGVFVNRDSTIGISREWFAPDATSGANDTAQYVISCTRFYNLTGSAINNVIVGEIIDWDIPSAQGSNNRSGLTGGIVYQQGIDTNDAVECQPFANRFGGSDVLGWYYTSAFAGDTCVNNTERGQYASLNASQLFPGSSSNGDLDTILPNIAAIGLAEAANTDTLDQHITTFYGSTNNADFTGGTGYTLPVGDTLVVYTAYATVKNGSAADLGTALTDACTWYNDNIRPGCSVCGCCVGSTGDVNCDGSVGLPDLSTLIDHLFITFTPLCCDGEGDVNADGSVGLPDLSTLIDNLFITFTPLPPCA